jgi:tetratricopeptide (TPR) repeat protein
VEVRRTTLAGPRDCGSYFPVSNFQFPFSVLPFPGWRCEVQMRQKLVYLTILLILAAGVVPAQETGQHRLNQDEVYNLIKQDKHQPELIEKTLHDRGVDLDLNPDIEKKMRKAGADDQILQAIWAAGPTVRKFEGAVLTSATGTPLTSTYKEAMGYKTLEQASDPDTKIRMAMEFAQTFPGSKLLSYVFTQAATALQQKGDYAEAVKTGRKSLAIDADNTYSLLIVATSLSEPSMIRKSTDNGEWELAEAGSDAQKALDLLPQLPSRPGETPEQFAARKAGIESTAHAALGAVAMQQDKYNPAIEEFKKAISLSQPPKASLYFRLGEIYSNVGEKQQAIEAFSKAAELGKGTVIETYATRSLKELQQN